MKAFENGDAIQLTVYEPVYYQGPYLEVRGPHKLESYEKMGHCIPCME